VSVVQRTIWIAVLRISPRTSEKITQKHGLSADEVKEAVVCVSGLRFIWDEHPERGYRAIVETRIRGRRALVVLYPVDDQIGDVWSLGSAYLVEG
jgi:hypothetical protein